MSSTAPLAGFRVVDLTNGLAGTSCTKFLSSYGADVIKIENPDGGDMTRNLVPWVFQTFNGGKRSLTVDLREKSGQDIVRRLATSSDVLVQSMRPGALEEIGLGRAELTAANPSLIYASFSAFGSSGPSSHRRGVDPVVQAESGLAEIVGRVMDNVSVIDAAGGLALAQGVLAALMLRERSGVAEHVEVNLLDTAVYLQAALYTEFSATGRTFDQDSFDEMFPTVGTFEAADGPLYIAAYWQRDWATICDLVGRPEWLEDARFCDAASRSANRDALREGINAELKRRPRRQWVGELEQLGILAGERRRYAEVLADEQVQHNQTFEAIQLADDKTVSIPRSPVRLGGRPLPGLGAAPALGQDTDSILLSLQNLAPSGRG
ncbi:MAG TPA: CoA transferase [Mycobacterium sp.]|nr:CoA transferase [Mycobacterium sp.]